MVKTGPKPKRRRQKNGPTKDGTFRSLEEYLSELKPHTKLNGDKIGVETEEDFITYLGCLDNYMLHLKTHRPEIHQKALQYLKGVNDWPTFCEAFDPFLEYLQYPFLWDGFLIMDNFAVERDPRIEEINFSIMIIEMEEVDRLRHEISPAVFNYLKRACIAVDQRNDDSMLGQNSEIRMEYHGGLGYDEEEFDPETRAYQKLYLKATEKLHRSVYRYKKYVNAKRPAKKLTELEETLVKCADAILEFDPNYLESFIDINMYRGFDDPLYTPEDVISYYFNSNYACTYSIPGVDLMDAYVEDLQSYERESSFYVCLDEVAKVYPDRIEIDPYRPEKLASAYAYFEAFDTLYKLFKKRRDARSIQNK